MKKKRKLEDLKSRYLKTTEKEAGWIFLQNYSKKVKYLPGVEECSVEEALRRHDGVEIELNCHQSESCLFQVSL
jgi:hypothetical protein